MTTVGSYRLELSVMGNPISGSPLPFSIVPGMPDGERSVLTPPPGTIEPGKRATFSIQASDMYGNLVTTGGGKVLAKLVGPNPGKVEVDDLHNGTYKVHLEIAQDVDDKFVVRLEGKEVRMQQIGPAPLP